MIAFGWYALPVRGGLQQRRGSLSFTHFRCQFEKCCGEVSGVLRGQLDRVSTCGRAKHDWLIAFEPQSNICGNAPRWSDVDGICHAVIMPAFPLRNRQSRNARQGEKSVPTSITNPLHRRDGGGRHRWLG